MLVTTPCNCNGNGANVYLVEVYGPADCRSIHNGHFRTALNLYSCIVYTKCFQRRQQVLY